jgi:hypothetical protein
MQRLFSRCTWRTPTSFLGKTGAILAGTLVIGTGGCIGLESYKLVKKIYPPQKTPQYDYLGAVLWSGMGLFSLDVTRHIWQSLPHQHNFCKAAMSGSSILFFLGLATLCGLFLKHNHDSYTYNLKEFQLSKVAVTK